MIFTGRISADKVPNYLSNAKALLLARPNNIQAKYGFGEVTSPDAIITNISELCDCIKEFDL